MVSSAFLVVASTDLPRNGCINNQEPRWDILLVLGKNIHNRNNTAVSFVASWRISRIVAADGALVFANCRAGLAPTLPSFNKASQQVSGSAGMLGLS